MDLKGWTAFQAEFKGGAELGGTWVEERGFMEGGEG